jgi:hypothetical protein
MSLSAYKGILDRCYSPRSPSFRWYGEKGIRCLFTFEEFQTIYYRTDYCELCGVLLNDQSPLAANGRTIDRIDSNDNYEFRNVRIICRSCNSQLATSANVFRLIKPL